MDEKDQMDETIHEQEPMLYELAYILAPNIVEEQVAQNAANVTGRIEKLGGTITLADNPKMRTLAYQIEKAIAGKRQKYTSGYFGWVKFMMQPSKINELENEMRGIVEVVRSMIIHAVKVVPSTPRRIPRADGAAADAPKPTEAELDKEVDNLIASTVPVNA